MNTESVKHAEKYRCRRGGVFDSDGRRVGGPNGARRASEQENRVWKLKDDENTCNNAEGSQNPKKQPTLVAAKQSNGKSRLIKAAAILACILSVLTPIGQAKGATITVNADQVLHTNSPYLTGSCIEDVNHEIYGGIDSQMIFGESFAEPAAQLRLKGFKAYEGRWTLADAGSVQA